MCGMCGTPLVEREVGQREERKVVTALFCDLVGFTALSESADAEDVNTMLASYPRWRGPRSRATAVWSKIHR